MTEVEQYLHKQHAEQALKRLPKFEQNTLTRLGRTEADIREIRAMSVWLIIAIVILAVALLGVLIWKL